MIDYIFISLDELKKGIKENRRFDINALKNAFSNFKCIRNTELEEFLIKDAEKFEERNYSRTYLYINKKGFFEENTIDIIAYFAIAQDSTDVSSFSEESKKKIFPGFPRIKKRVSVPSYLIGQIARNDKYTKKQFDGKIMLNDCHMLIDKAVKISGGIVVVVDCTDNMVSYYKKKGFDNFNDTNNGNLKRLALAINSWDYIK